LTDPSSLPDRFGVDDLMEGAAALDHVEVPGLHGLPGWSGGWR
jgi:hypothetical protein